MTGRGVVYDLGYVPYDGERTGRAGVIRAMVGDGLMRIFGIRRRARRKVLPWLLVALAVLPATVFVGAAFLVQGLDADRDAFGGYVGYLGVVGNLVLLLVALAAPELIVPDRRHGVLAVYASRPLLPGDYLVARAAALAVALVGFLVVPQLLLLVGNAALEPQGFVAGLTADAGRLPAILGSAAVYAAAYGAPGLLVAGLSSRKAVASGAYLAAMLAGQGMVRTLVTIPRIPGGRWLALLSPIDHAPVLRDALFGRPPSADLLPVAAGLPTWTSAAAVLVVVAASAWVLRARYRRLL